VCAVSDGKDGGGLGSCEVCGVPGTWVYVWCVCILCGVLVSMESHTPLVPQLSVGLGLIKAKGAFGFLALPNSVYGIIYYIALSLTHLPST
jgi:hypothetical protein